MRAVVRKTLGSPDVLELQELDKPDLTDDGVLLRVHMALGNRGGWYAVTGTPYVGRTPMGLLKPKQHVLGGEGHATV